MKRNRRRDYKDWQLQHDPKHTTKSGKNWLAKNQFKVLFWLAMSFDLNSIENLWKEVKKFMKGQKYNNPDTLFETVQQAWVSLLKKLLETLIESKPRRCQAVINAKRYQILVYFQKNC